MTVIHLLSGATGFIGGAVVLELLRDPESEVYVLVRGQDPAHARRRLCNALTAAATAYDATPLWKSGEHRVHPVHGDVEAALWGLDLPRALPGGVRYIWHCAATLHYELHRAERIDSVNHHGTRHAIDLARRLGAQLNHMSTAYIAPSRDDGVLVEQPAVEQSAAPATPYHHAKIRAERAVVESEIVWRILRPSFVVGHARTHAATHHAGYYAMARRLTIAARRHLVPEGARAILPVPPDATINLVPVDTVARAVVAVGTLGETGTVYHLANAEPPTSRSVLEALFAWTDLPRPEFVPPGEARLPGPAGALQRYLPFFGVNQLDLDHTRRVTGSSAMAAPLAAADLLAYLDCYKATLQAV
ncbi:NAD-dependent epimerase/dehydratase family protein [Streptomyces sp. CJ_13]|uniref:SDR family oxidoreductase n=1 Tax=Streptomyces sp. CJ_13 TaxID=2724943 RepID=UPI001BDCF2E3|nr:SDR family oxidoreductase [Streptomyces sp. CJ_13]MBT1184014.1 NAD-dependent epimerase/dehydratase family protein [Streptomyces sp. CJ_13]